MFGILRKINDLSAQIAGLEETVHQNELRNKTRLELFHENLRELRERPTLFCSFCGESQHKVKKLIAGPGVYICDGCALIAANIGKEAG